MSGTVAPGVVVFDYQGWRASFPELGFLNGGLAQAYFIEAGLYLDNTVASPVQDPVVRSVLLNLLVAHIAKMRAPINGEAPSSLVGRVSSATEGSVSVSAAYSEAKSNLEAWACQTTYGASWWAATAQYRRFQYAVNPAMLCRGRFW